MILLPLVYNVSSNERQSMFLFNKWVNLKFRSTKNNLPVRVIMFTATYNNNSVISWRSVLLVEETGVPEKNQRPAANHWQTYSCIKYASPGRVSNCQLCIQSLLKCTHNVTSSSTGSVLRSISEHSIMDIHVSRMLKSMMYLHIYIYTTSEKPVDDQSYGVLDRYGITILYK
jgi:hypothetical protein